MPLLTVTVSLFITTYGKDDDVDIIFWGSIKETEEAKQPVTAKGRSPHGGIRSRIDDDGIEEEAAALSSIVEEDDDDDEDDEEEGEDEEEEEEEGGAAIDNVDEEGVTLLARALLMGLPGMKTERASHCGATRGNAGADADADGDKAVLLSRLLVLLGSAEVTEARSLVSAERGEEDDVDEIVPSSMTDEEGDGDSAASLASSTA